MALKLYIAYGTAVDQVIALRLQALAAVNGLSVYVPPAYTRRVTAINLEPESEAELIDSDIILGIITTGMSDACRQELNAAQSFGTKAMVIADPACASWLQNQFRGDVVVIDPANPAAAEQQIVQLLKQTEIEQAAKTALIALWHLSVGTYVICPSGMTGRPPF